ncbi:MAG TPA: ATP-dependent helicase [Porphyromonadaceae bacterium]|nr:ATP-dependent helicase [Porphyromonadaceae bacterium]
MNLRDYQQALIQAVREGFRTTGKRQVLMAPTGSGKTHVASYMIQQAASKGLRCMFVCDRIELINQTSSRFYADGIDHGVIQADHPFYFPELPVQVCSIQTLARRKMMNFDLLVIDECHALHQAHINLMNANDGYVVGLSATPFAKGMGKHFDGLVQPVSTEFLINAGYLSKFEAYGPNTIDVTGIKTIAGDYDPQELGERVDKPHLVADVVDTWKKLAAGRKTICFATNRAHSRHLVREFTKNGITADHIDCYTGKLADDESREDVIGRFKNGETTVLCNVDILTKGFDYPEVSCIIQARPTKSLMVHIQQVGRGLRIADGKESCIILDHAGNHERLGFVDAKLPSELDNGKKKTSSGTSKEKEKETPLPKRCPSCDFLKPAGVRKCPACGLVPAFAENVEVAEGELERLRRKDRREYTAAEKQEFLAGLNQWCTDKGWNPGRKGCFGTALKMYEQKFGAEPSSKFDWGALGPITEDVRKFITHSMIRRTKSREKDSRLAESQGVR